MSHAEEGFIELERDAGLLVATIRRPDKKNALSLESFAALRAAMDEVAGHEEGGALVLRGHGDDFTSGADIADFAGRPERMGEVVDFLHELVDFPSPLVVAVRGLAVGIGSTLLMHADAVIAGPSARFRLPFTSLGLVPEAGSSVLLPRTAGMALASDLLLSGRFFGVEEARFAGLVSQVVEDDLVDSTARGIAFEMAAQPPGALAASKALLREPLSDLVHEAIDREAAEFARRLSSDEVQVGLREFLGG